MPIRTIIVDDEPLARDKLSAFLEKEGDIEILAQCRDGREAVEAIDREKPDLVFLDVQMPEMDGFEVLENIDTENLPTVIFTTAYDQYAIKAFDVHAVDYLLKPFDRERFGQALARARSEQEKRRVGEMEQRLMDLIGDLEKRRETETKYPERLVVKSSGKVVFIKVTDIDWVDAAGNYVRLHISGDSHLMRETMGRIEARLDPEQFLRIHRSTIVNIERIRELQQQFHGDYLVVLKSGQRLTLSRSYRDKIQGLLDSAG